ncbi:MAG: C_GCAxxG_C_C family protein [Clostridiales bacterium]|jgi:C_GCAxxG_C_C family probable redox protein|nr:C_GCAxxG_C_C family protein [Clostridiales bacterium]
MNDTAFKLFRLSSLGYCCTQIMLKLALDEEEKENEDLLRAVSVLCRGIGGRQKTCGVLTGGLGILGLYAAKGKDTEYPKANLNDMTKEYMEWFENEFGSEECMDIIGVHSFADNTGKDAYMVKCGDILLKSYQKVVQILRENNYEYGSREC